MKLRLRTTAAALVTVAGTVGVAGCSVFSPATVLKPYQPSDGTGATVGGVEVRNALVVSTGADEPGVVSAVVVNSGTEDASVSVSAGAATTQSFTVPAGRSLHLGDPSATEGGGTQGAATAGPLPLVGWLQIPSVGAVPGETVPVTFSVSGQSAEVAAPVLLPCFEYATITPTAPAAGTGTAPATADPADTACGPPEGEDTGVGGEEEE